MLDPNDLPQIAADEIVTRFLMYGKWFRADRTVKHDAFMPPVNLELSVTRLLQATDVELWQVGGQVAAASNRKLHGRVDLVVEAFVRQQLLVEPDVVPGNPNHAKVTGWPTEKSAQMMTAKSLAAMPECRRIPPPAGFSSPLDSST